MLQIVCGEAVESCGIGVGFCYLLEDGGRMTDDECINFDKVRRVAKRRQEI